MLLEVVESTHLKRRKAEVDIGNAGRKDRYGVFQVELNCGECELHL
jgi:hypothetical protein